jgi:hypothetical protein
VDSTVEPAGVGENKIPFLTFNFQSRMDKRNPILV